MTKVRGFTLLELVIVMIIVAVLAAVAFAAYTKQMRKSRRYDAVTAISNMQTLQQRWRASHATFGTLANLGFADPAPSPGGYYSLTMQTPPSAGACGVGTMSDFNSYKITATAVARQAEDTGCATFVLTNLCGVITKTSTGGDTCWP
jgi:type IV pilus assembly protein PilE